MTHPTTEKTIKVKMSTALSGKMASLSVEMKRILIDDLGCAFENTLKVLSTAEPNFQEQDEIDICSALT